MSGVVHRALKLQHHSHTGKKLHHHHTSYRALFGVLAVAALSMGMIQRVGAADISVSASIPSDHVTTPAEITAPHASDVMVSSSVTVSGTCQVVRDGTIVIIERDGVPLGSAPCQNTGTFSLPITLVIGENSLVPRSMNGLGVYGPDGPGVVLSWQPNTGGGGTSTPPAPLAEIVPVPGASSPVVSGGGTGETERLQVLPAGDGIVTYQSGKSASISVSIKAGVTPYTLLIDWGDGSGLQMATLDAAGQFDFDHAYSVSGFHIITVRVVDSAGTESVMQVVGTATFAAPVTVLGGPNVRFGGLFEAFGSPVTRIVWTFYFLIFGLVIILWVASPGHSLLPGLVLSHDAKHLRHARKP